MANNRANKRQKVGNDFFQTESDYKAPEPLKSARGKTFLEGIEKLARTDSMEGVFTQLDLPFTNRTYKTTGRKYKVTKAIDTPGKVGLIATIGVMRPGEKKEFAQGVLMPMGKTSYFDDQKRGKAVPSKMTMKTAKMESRAMKYLSMDGTEYTPKTDIVADELKPKTEALVNKKRAAEEVHWGGLAVGSFLEEITGGRGLGMHGVGSGMRAMTMASKWNMKRTGANKDPGFGDRMLAAFPQLGKKKMGTGYGASALYQDVKNPGAARDKVLKHHLGLGGSIYKAHLEARTAAKDVFNEKVKAIQTGAGLAATSGKWWTEKAKTVDFSKLGQTELKDLRREYMQTKLDRHAIYMADNPHRVAKRAAQADLQKRSIDKATNAALYKQEKHTFVVNSMKAAGFDTTKVEKQRLTKDKFAAKLDVAGAGVGVKGKWWSEKAKTVDFKALDPTQRKELKQEYVAHRKAKGK